MSKNRIQIPEQQLIELLKAQKQEGFDYLYSSYSAALLGVSLRIVSDRQLAEEVVHDTFIKIWKSMESYNSDKGRLFTWMARICRNSSLDMVKSKGVKKSLKTNSIDNVVHETEAGLTESFNVETIGVKEWLNALNKEQRDVIEALYFQGMSQSQAADELEIPLGTVKTRLRIGLRTIREKLAIR